MEYYDANYFQSYEEKRSLPVIGDKDFREILPDIIVRVPKDTLDAVLKNCVFLLLTIRVPAGYIPHKLIAGRSVLAFYEMLYAQDGCEQVKMVLHEIAHYVLNHIDEGLSEEEYKKQEKEADSLRDKWIDDWERYYRASDEEAMKPWKGVIE